MQLAEPEIDVCSTETARVRADSDAQPTDERRRLPRRLCTPRRMPRDRKSALSQRTGSVSPRRLTPARASSRSQASGFSLSNPRGAIPSVFQEEMV
jgi:hypothetical protein